MFGSPLNERICLCHNATYFKLKKWKPRGATGKMLQQSHFGRLNFYHSQSDHCHWVTLWLSTWPQPYRFLHFLCSVQNRYLNHKAQISKLPLSHKFPTLPLANSDQVGHPWCQPHRWLWIHSGSGASAQQFFSKIKLNRTLVKFMDISSWIMLVQNPAHNLPFRNLEGTCFRVSAASYWGGM